MPQPMSRATISCVYERGRPSSNRAASVRPSLSKSLSVTRPVIAATGSCEARAVQYSWISSERVPISRPAYMLWRLLSRPITGCCSLLERENHRTVFAIPSISEVFASNPKRRFAFSTSGFLRTWPSGFVRSNTTLECLPDFSRMIWTSRATEISSEEPILIG